MKEAETLSHILLRCPMYKSHTVAFHPNHLTSDEFSDDTYNTSSVSPISVKYILIYFMFLRQETLKRMICISISINLFTSVYLPI